jgi:hypothetical protein
MLEPEEEQTWPPDPAGFAVLNRLTAGPRPAEIHRLAETGLAGWLDEQLSPQGLDDGPLNLRLRPLATLGLRAGEIADLGDKLFDDLDRISAPQELRQALLIRQVYSRRQLYEQMVEFWGDHFNISVDKGDCWFLKTVDDREVIRLHALGRFRDLLWASAHSPAMLVYLDNQANQRGAPNENYARELLELHTLGEGHGYTQQDVMELARCLTGWGVKERFWRGEFRFDPQAHDEGVKQVLDLRLAPSGQAEAEAVLDRLAAHPATAHNLAFKLARRFIADQPPAWLVEAGAEAFQRSGGDLRVTARSLLLEGLAHRQPKFKRPIQFVVSALRLLEAEIDGGPVLQDHLLRMGQSPFAWPTPDGYPDLAEAWMGNLAPRWNFALALVQNEIPGARLNLPALLERESAFSLESALDILCARLLGAPLPLDRRKALLGAFLEAGPADELQLAQAAAAGLVASPAFQWR